MNKAKSLIIVLVCYIFALFCSVLFIVVFNNNTIYTLLYADIIATIIIYLASYIFKNSSIYDPYWSVIPPLLLFFWIITSNKINFLNTALVSFSVMFWAIRLTYNWARGWKGLSQEDWRYIDLKKRAGRFYELVNFSGIHLFPTLIVFACCIPFKYIVVSSITRIDVLIGFSICAIGVLYEIISDQQLYNFKKHNSNQIIDCGLWKYSRHPNYYGEILFWWGIYIYTISSKIELVAWPICMTLMFLYISIPWIENKILKTRLEYREYQKNVNVLIPEITLVKNVIKRSKY